MASSALPLLWRCWRNRPITCGSNSQFAENHRVFGRQVQVRYGNFPPEAEVPLFGFLPKLQWENPDLRPTLRTAFWVRIVAPINRTITLDQGSQAPGVRKPDPKAQAAVARDFQQQLDDLLEGLSDQVALASIRPWT